jgi:hypothetical protein
MGNYFNPPGELETIGRRFNSLPKYELLMSELKPGEVLVGRYFNGMFNAAPHLFSAEEFAAFEDSYGRGMFLSRSFFAVPADIDGFGHPISTESVLGGGHLMFAHKPGDTHPQEGSGRP